jgi:peptidoglycan/LPS O-acetylase OafA/YrhL
MVAFVLALVVGPAVILAMSYKNMDTTYSWGMVRCLYGFCAGVLTYRIWRARRTVFETRLQEKLVWNLAEIGAVAVMAAFVATAGIAQMSVAAPFVFAVAVFIFAFEAGAISALFRKRLFAVIGAASYSIYMIHVFLVEILRAVIARVQPKVGVSLFTTVSSGGLERNLLGPNRWWGDLWALLFLVVLIVTSYLLFRTIEKPSRRWLRAHVPAGKGELESGLVGDRAGAVGRMPAGG